jgi:hypothetical protein
MRDGVMDMTTFYRSHDIFSGFKYDAMLSSFVLNMLCSWLRASGVDAKPGKLYFFDGSLHYYPKKDGDKIYRALESFEEDNLSNNISIIKDDISPTDFFKDMWNVKRSEEASYFGNFEAAEKKRDEIVYEPMRNFANVYIMRNKKFNKEKGDKR